MPSLCETIFSFLTSPQPPFYSTYSAMSMAHAHVCVKIEKVREHQKYETIAWLVIGVVHDLNICVMKIEHS